MNAEWQMANSGHGGNVHAWARAGGSSVDSVLDFSANINPLGLAGSVQQAIDQSIKLIVHYPDAEAALLKAAISSYYNVDVEAITAGNGAVELLYVLAHTLRPKRVLIPAPSFSEYQRAARAADAEVEYAYLSPANNFAVDIDAICNRLHHVDMVFIGNPNNPTGTLLPRSALERLVSAAGQAGVLVVIDESFIDFISDGHAYTCRPLLTQYDNLVIVHSLTKFYAIPGLRLGFALSNPRLAGRLHAAKDPWNVNLIAQAAGVAALSDQCYQETSRQVVECEKKILYAGLQALTGLKPFLPSVNYILIDIAATGQTAARLQQTLAEQGILIRDCSNYPGLSPYYIRVAVKLHEQNKMLLMRLEQAVR